MPAKTPRKKRRKSQEFAKHSLQLQRIAVLNNEIQNLESQLARERDRLAEAKKRKELFEGKEARQTRAAFSPFRTIKFVPVNLIQRIMWYLFPIGRKKSFAFPSEKKEGQNTLTSRKPLTMKDYHKLRTQATIDFRERGEIVRRLKGELAGKRSELSSLERTVQEQG